LRSGVARPASRSRLGPNDAMKGAGLPAVDAPRRPRLRARSRRLRVDLDLTSRRATTSPMHHGSMLPRTSSAFRGSEGLSLEKPDAIADPIAVDEALKSRSRRTLAERAGPAATADVHRVCF
jgi:hypothetical protein